MLGVKVRSVLENQEVMVFAWVAVLSPSQPPCSMLLESKDNGLLLDS